MKYRTLAVALLLLLTGCGTNPPEPDLSETPAPSTSQSADPLYEEAVAVAKAIDEIDRKYYYQDKFDPFPADEYSEYADEGFVQATKALYEAAIKNDRETLSVENVSIKYREFSGVSKDGSEIALQQCLDGREAEFRENGEVTKGGKAQNIYFFKHIDGKLKAVGVEADKKGECAW